MQRRSLRPIDFAVWASAAFLLLVGLAAAPAWEALDPVLGAELRILDESLDDPWETPFALDDEAIRCAGPDRTWETPDDFVLSEKLWRARSSRMLPALAVLGVLLLAGWELGFVVVGLMGGRWRGWFDESLIVGGWALVGGLLVWGTAELLVRREVLELPNTDWLAVSWSTAVAGSGAAAGAVTGLLLRLRLAQASEVRETSEPERDPGAPTDPSEPPAPQA